MTLPPSKKTRALLAYLISTGRPQTRERLCDLLWEGPDDPRAALRWSLTKLRPLLDEADTIRLVTDRERIAFAAHGAVVDVTRLAAFASIGVSNASIDELRTAAGLFTGEFADGLDLPTCFRFHEWCAAEREKWAALRQTILSALIERLHDLPEEALIYARNRAALDALDETGHIAVIQLLTTLGRQREALRHYDYCRQVLEAELGVRPSTELEQAGAKARRAGSTHAGAIPREAPAPLPPRSMDPKMTGRSAECMALDAIVAATASSHTRPGLVLLTGDPGIGKSRLLRYFERSFAGMDGQVLTARAFEAEMRRPYGIWADLFESLRGGANSLARWPELRPLIRGTHHRQRTQEGDRVQLFAGVVSVLTELAARAPVAVLIDDLQWVDESSLSLLHYVIRAFDASGRVVLAATARASELSDNGPATRLVRGLARERRLGEIPIGPLDRDASLALATATAPNRDVAPVIAASEGNPLFTIELARALAADESTLPDNIENVLAEHLSRPDPSARALLPWAAALGREFDIAILTRCVNLSPGEWNGALEELERRRIFRCVGEARYDFSHDLIRGAAYRSLSQPRRHLLHGQIAQSIAAALDANEADPSVAGELTRHAELGGNHALAVRGCVLAGEHCMRLFANDEAIAFAERGLRHLSALRSDTDQARLHIALLKVQILASPGSRLRRWPSLMSELLDAVAAAEADGFEAEAATGYYLLSVLHQDEGDAVEAQATTLRAAEVSRHADTATTVAQLANTARCLIELEQDIGRSRGLLAEANSMSARRGAKTIEMLWSEALLRRWDGILDAAPPLLEEALQLAREGEDRWRECKCLAWLAVINFERGDPEASLACCEELRPLAAKMGESGEVPFVRALEALARLTLHQTGAAHDLVSAVERLRSFDSKAHLAYVLNAAAEIAMAAGEFHEACGIAQEALAAAEATRRVCEIVTSRALLARALTAGGDVLAARGWLDPILARFEDCDGVSARARSAGLFAARAMGLRIPTTNRTLV